MSTLTQLAKIWAIRRASKALGKPWTTADVVLAYRAGYKQAQKEAK